MPLRKMDFMSSVFALAEPVPFTVAILIAKSFVLSWVITRPFLNGEGNLCRLGGRFILGMRPLHERFLHVPRRGRAALGAQSAVNAEIFVLHHDPRRVLER